MVYVTTTVSYSLFFYSGRRRHFCKQHLDCSELTAAEALIPVILSHFFHRRAFSVPKFFFTNSSTFGMAPSSAHRFSACWATFLLSQVPVSLVLELSPYQVLDLGRILILLLTFSSSITPCPPKWSVKAKGWKHYPKKWNTIWLLLHHQMSTSCYISRTSKSQ